MFSSSTTSFYTTPPPPPPPAATTTTTAITNSGGPIHVRITDFNTSTTLVPEEASGGICCGCFSRASHAPPPPATPPDEDFHCEDLLRLSLGYTAYRVIEPSRPLTDPPPLVVCLHGLYTSSSCYADLSELLAEYEEGPHARVLLYDFYGRGRSPWTGLPLSLDMYVTQLKELLDGKPSSSSSSCCYYSCSFITFANSVPVLLILPPFLLLLLLLLPQPQQQLLYCTVLF
eukprot:scaffold510_cov179-Ochromonas_danica.AAC.8